MNDDVFEYVEAIEDLENLPVLPPKTTRIIKVDIVRKEDEK